MDAPQWALHSVHSRVFAEFVAVTSEPMLGDVIRTPANVARLLALMDVPPCSADIRLREVIESDLSKFSECLCEHFSSSVTRAG